MLRPSHRAKQTNASTSSTKLGAADSASPTQQQMHHKSLNRHEDSDTDEFEGDHHNEKANVYASRLSKSGQNEDDVDKLVNSMSALKFVPPSIRFGRGGKGGLAKR